MRCCTKCGCYLPDGMVSCLACGFDNSKSPVRIVDSTGGSDGRAVLTEFNPMSIVKAPVMPTITELQYFDYFDQGDGTWKRYPNGLRKDRF